MVSGFTNPIDVSDLPYGFAYKFRIAFYDILSGRWTQFSDPSNVIDTRIGIFLHFYLNIIWPHAHHLLFTI